ncbi:MAG: UDP-glucose 4-epimerase GalE [Acidobacteriaceae bacterium]
MSILITGGAGYIGAHTAHLLRGQGQQVVVLDNLATGRKENIRAGNWIQGDIADVNLVRSVLRDYAVTSVLHLAADAHVGESMIHPDRYFANNTCGTLKLLDAMIAEQVLQFVFASSSSVYGNSTSSAISEEFDAVPVSPYGESKLQSEKVLPWYSRAHGLCWTALRYFNVAGASDGLGEDVTHSSRIIPRAIYAAIRSGPPVQVFGTDFPTRDGSAVRDFVHVSDVARANLLALQLIESRRSGGVINIGSGAGVSVLQILHTVSRQIGTPVPHSKGPPRPGDPPCTVSDISRARQILDWNPLQSSLENIIASVAEPCLSKLVSGSSA